MHSVSVPQKPSVEDLQTVGNGNVGYLKGDSKLIYHSSYGTEQPRHLHLHFHLQAEIRKYCACSSALNKHDVIHQKCFSHRHLPQPN
jgi:hypothetical protein